MLLKEVIQVVSFWWFLVSGKIKVQDPLEDVSLSVPGVALFTGRAVHPSVLGLQSVPTAR